MSDEVQGSNPQYIMHADDDPEDIEILTEALHRIDPVINILDFPDGSNAFNHLELITPGGLLPAVIVLDMNMRQWDGFRTLGELKSSPAYKNIPVFIFSNSTDGEHRTQSIRKGAAGFVTKPAEHHKVLQTAIMFNAYRYFPPRYKL